MEKIQELDRFKKNKGNVRLRINAKFSIPCYITADNLIRLESAHVVNNLNTKYFICIN
ncbi:MAG: hypothetical protein ACOC22_01025 [bacterium]